MSHRKREITGLLNEREFPRLVDLTLLPGGFRGIFLEIDAFHRERRMSPRRGRSPHDIGEFSHPVLFPGCRDCRRISG